MVATVASAVVVGLLPAAIVAAIFAGPAIGFVRLHRYLRTKRRKKLYMATTALRNELNNLHRLHHQITALVPRRELVDDLSGQEMDLLVQRLVTNLQDRHEARRHSDILAPPPQNSGADPDGPAPTRYARALAACDQEMLIAEKDEVTSL